MGVHRLSVPSRAVAALNRAMRAATAVVLLAGSATGNASVAINAALALAVTALPIIL